MRFLAKTVSDIHALIRVVIRQRDQSRSAADRKAKQEFIDGLENDALALAVFVDPPIDTLSHQVQFIIVWGASANPGWTLLKFKGPNPRLGIDAVRLGNEDTYPQCRARTAIEPRFTERILCAADRHRGFQFDQYGAADSALIGRGRPPVRVIKRDPAISSWWKRCDFAARGAVRRAGRPEDGKEEKACGESRGGKTRSSEDREEENRDEKARTQASHDDEGRREERRTREIEVAEDRSGVLARGSEAQEGAHGSARAHRRGCVPGGPRGRASDAGTGVRAPSSRRSTAWRGAASTASRKTFATGWGHSSA